MGVTGTETFIVGHAPLATNNKTPLLNDPVLSVGIIPSNMLSRPMTRFIFSEAKAGEIYQDLAVDQFDPAHPPRSGKSKYMMTVELTKKGPRIQIYKKEFEVRADPIEGKLKLVEPDSYLQVQGDEAKQLKNEIKERLGKRFSGKRIEDIFSEQAGAVRGALGDLGIYARSPLDDIDISILPSASQSARVLGTIR